MNILTYVPMPMLIIVHGGGGSVAVPHYAGICFVGTLCIIVVGSLFGAFALAAMVFGKDHIATLMVWAMVVALVCCLLTLCAGVFCGLLGV